MKGLGIIQTRILEIVKREEPISMQAVRTRIYPSDWKTAYARKAISVAVRSLEQRGLIFRLARRKQGVTMLATTA
jgi:hypothetical protein